MCNFAAIPLGNSSLLCIGGITESEAVEVREGGVETDGRGFYLFLASAERPNSPIRVLAKFFSAAEAEEVAKLFPEVA